MPIENPANEEQRLSLLSTPARQKYLAYKAAANRVVDEKYPADKYPEMKRAGQIYTEYFSDYLDRMQKLRFDTHTTDGKPLHPRYIDQEIVKAENKLTEEFDKKYPIFTGPHAKENKIALQRLKTEIQGESLPVRFFNGIYNENDGGMQWSSIAGGVAVGTLGALMGSFMASGAGAMGAGWLGTAAVLLLAGAGMVFGAQVGYKVANPPTPAPAPTAKAATAQGVGESKTPERDAAAEQRAKEEAEQKANEAAAAERGKTDAQEAPISALTVSPYYSPTPQPPATNNR